MATKQDFTAEEWGKVMDSAMLASVAITAAEPHGLWGTLQEGWANAKGLAAGRSSEAPLVRDVVAALATSEARSSVSASIKARLAGVKSASEVVDRALAAVTEASKVLDAKGGADATAFKKWIYGNAEAVAESSTEGGFLGFGGVKVSEKERATLDHIAQALGIPA
ncbi:MAG: hypothetical protein JSS20_04320 [Proteobacteria bacterium]|nr:hypothetical protein [Pseudomonadota bacterium]